MTRAALLFACSALLAQDAHEPILRVTVNLIQVDAVVTDRHGRHIPDLGKDDFQLYQDGKLQKITSLSYVTGAAPAQPVAVPVSSPMPYAAAPLTPNLRPEQASRSIALIADDLTLSSESVNNVRQALTKFVDEQMQPGDVVAILRTSSSNGSLQQFTSDKKLLHAAIDRIGWNVAGRGASALPAIGLERDDVAARLAAGYSTASYEQQQFRDKVFAIGTIGTLNYVIQGLGALPGRKAVIFFSDGLKLRNSAKDVLRGRDVVSPKLVEQFRKVTDLANRAAVVLYTIDARGLAVTAIHAEDHLGSTAAIPRYINDRNDQVVENFDGLEYLAHQTGGLFWKNTNDLAGAARDAIQDRNGYYLLSYNPGSEVFELKQAETKYHHISVKVSRPGLQVRTRSGFYGIPDKDVHPSVDVIGQPLTDAFSSPFSSGDVGLRVTAYFVNDPKNGSAVRTMLHIDGRDLDFHDDADGWHKAAVDVVVMAFGENGSSESVTKRTYTFRAKGQGYEDALRWGYVYSVMHPIKKPGAYQLRAAVRDASPNKVGSASQFIEVPDLSKGRLALSGLAVQSVRYSAAALPEEEGQTGAGDPSGGPELRVFHPGEPIFYGVVVYNSKLAGSTRKPDVEILTRVYREGKLVWSGEPFSLADVAPKDPKRIRVAQQLNFGATTPPGKYLMEVIAFDKLAGKTEGAARQWTDFEFRVSP